MDLADFIHQNPIFSTVAVGGAGGYLISAGREIPKKIKDVLTRKFTSSIEICSADAFFPYFSEWLSLQEHSKKVRKLLVSKDEAEHKLSFTPGTGDHVFFFRRRLVWLTRFRDEKATPGGFSGPTKPLEYITFRVLDPNIQVLRDLFVDILNEMLSKRNDPRTRVLVNRYGGWDVIARKNPRPVESVILPDGQAEQIINDLQKFIDNEQWYADTGIPYRRGYLLHGLPGTGKTSLVRAIASHFGMSLCVLTLSDKKLTDSSLLNLLASVEPNSLVLLEDIDALFRDRTYEAKDDDKDGDETGVTFSGLLNALDGVATKEGLITFMSTNHVDRLDPALIRPGRCDMKIEFQNATHSQLFRLYSRFNPDKSQLHWPEQFASQYADRVTMAQAQEILLEARA